MISKRSIFILLMAFVVAMQTHAQDKRPKFSPEKFKADMEQFIVTEACLTPEASAKFFPVYDEMQKKQRAVFSRMRRVGRVKPTDEEGCREAIEKRDRLELDLKQIQQTYHNKMMTIIPASKLFDVIKAEDKFHRRMMNRYNRPQRQNKHKDK